MKVYNELGSGFLEKVYQEALEIELKAANIPYQREAQLQVVYKGVPLQQTYAADFICYDKVIVELESVAKEKVQEYNKERSLYYESKGCKISWSKRFKIGGV